MCCAGFTSVFNSSATRYYQYLKLGTNKNTRRFKSKLSIKEYAVLNNDKYDWINDVHPHFNLCGCERKFLTISFYIVLSTNVFSKANILLNPASLLSYYAIHHIHINKLLKWT